MSGPGTLCVWLQRSVSGPGALCVRASAALCLAPALSGGLGSVETVPAPANPHQRYLCRAPAVSVSGLGALRHSLCRASTQILLNTSVSGLGGLCIGARRSPAPCSSPRTPSSDPRATHAAPRLPAPIRMACHPSSTQAPSSACHPSNTEASSSNPRATHPARRVPLFQERTPNLPVWGKVYLVNRLFLFFPFPFFAVLKL